MTSRALQSAIEAAGWRVTVEREGAIYCAEAVYGPLTNVVYSTRKAETLRSLAQLCGVDLTRASNGP